MADLRSLRERARHPRAWLSALAWLGRHELGLLVALGCITLGVWSFAELADDVDEGETRSFDRRVLLAFRVPGDRTDPVGPRWLEEVVRDFTALGSTAVLVAIVLAVTGFLVLQGKRRQALLLGLAIGAGMGASRLLKAVFERPRPDLVPHATHVVSPSFPSGHAMMSAVVYLTLGALLARFLPSARLKGYVLALGLLVTLVVGTTRVWLGVHWPTDVLAGWAAGSAWALGCWVAVRALQRRGRVEDGEGRLEPDTAT